MPLAADVQDKVVLQADSLAVAENKPLSEVNVPGYIKVDGQYYTEYKPWDFSFTKNVLALFITAILVTLMMMSVVRWYKRNNLKAPRKGSGFLELIVEFVYNGVIKSTLGKKAPKFAPYLLTVFLFYFDYEPAWFDSYFPWWCQPYRQYSGYFGFSIADILYDQYKGY